MIKTQIILNICAIFILAFLFFISATWIGYKFEGTEDPFMEATNSTISFLAVLATLTAAYVASKLFNDWRAQHNKQVKNDFSLKAYNQFEIFDSTLIELKYAYEKMRENSRKTDCEGYLSQIQNNVKYSSDLARLTQSKESIEKVFTIMIQQFNHYGIVSGNRVVTSKNCDTFSNHFREINKFAKTDHIVIYLINIDRLIIGYDDLKVMIISEFLDQLLNELKIK